MPVLKHPRIIVGIVAFVLVLLSTGTVAYGMHTTTIQSVTAHHPQECLHIGTICKLDTSTETLLAEDYGEVQAKTTIATATPTQSKVVTYSIRTKGPTKSNIQEFSSLAAQTLADSRGWSKAGVGFKEVSSGGSFVLWRATAEQVPSFSSGCSSNYSCRVGKDVIINEERWNNATNSWNAAGGSLRDYRHMVVNHEVGHFLSLGHENCKTPGSPAPIMQQQSIDLQGCTFNPWPLAWEIAKV